MLAKGGVLSSGSAIVGEAGAELLSMRNGQAVVQPLTNNYTTNNYSSASNQPLSINVTMPDGTVLARAMYNPFQDIATLRGGKV